MDRKIDNFVSNVCLETCQEKVYGDTIVDQERSTSICDIKIQDMVGELEYSCGMTKNLDHGNITKFFVTLSLPCNWENRDIVLDVVKEFCETKVRDEFKQISEFPVTSEYNAIKSFKKLTYVQIPDNFIIPIKFALGKTISMGNYESSKFFISLKIYSSFEKIDEMYYNIREWVTINVDRISKEMIAKIRKYVNKTKKYPSRF